jgi:hypothetical protein
LPNGQLLSFQNRSFLVRTAHIAAIFMSLMVCMDLFGQITAALEAGAAVWKTKTSRSFCAMASRGKKQALRVVYGQSLCEPIHTLRTRFSGVLCEDCSGVVRASSNSRDGTPTRVIRFNRTGRTSSSGRTLMDVAMT